jgi:Permeases of the drug/metabolite transporter (DMT) superfamily
MLSLSSRAAIVGVCLCWAVGTILSKTLLSSFPPVTILVFQLAPSVIALWLAVIFSRSRIPPSRMLPSIALLGLLNPGWAYTFSMFGLAETSASVATLLWAFEPILIVGLAWAFLRERIDRQLISLVAVATCGVLLVSGIASGASSLTVKVSVELPASLHRDLVASAARRKLPYSAEASAKRNRRKSRIRSGTDPLHHETLLVHTPQPSGIERNYSGTG